MTILYNEKVISGNSYQRTNRVNISNELNENPMIDFSEETIITFSSGEQIRRPCGTLHMAMDPTFTVPIISPTTGEYVLNEDMSQKTVTLEELYVIFYSLYFEAARLRDAAIQESSE